MVAWSSAYALGLEEIDVQHKMLFDLINALWDHIVQQSPKEGATPLGELERYTLSHFTAEETFMRVSAILASASTRRPTRSSCS